MKQFLTNKELEHLAVPMFAMKQHQSQLKHALLSSSQQPTLASKLTKGWNKFMTAKPLALAGATLVAAVAITATSLLMPGSTASAQSVAKDSLQALAKLPADQLTNGTIAVNSEQQLRDAQKAADLTLLTYDQVAKQYPMVVGIGPEGLLDGKMPDLKALKFLKYTDAQGNTVFLGVDKNQLPVYSTIAIGEGVSQSSGTTQSNDSLQAGPDATMVVEPVANGSGTN